MGSINMKNTGLFLQELQDYEGKPGIIMGNTRLDILLHKIQDYYYRKYVNIRDIIQV